MITNFKIKRVFRLDTIQKHFRLFRLLWCVGKVGDGNGYSAKLSVALTPSFFTWDKQAVTDRLFILFGLRIHYVRSYGGIFV